MITYNSSGATVIDYQVPVSNILGYNWSTKKYQKGGEQKNTTLAERLST